MSKTILDELEIKCPFPEVFAEVENLSATVPVYKRKIGHLRADYDGYRWWNSAWPCHTELSNSETAKEINDVYSRLIAKDAFETFSDMSRFCLKHPEASKQSSSDDEYNFYYTGNVCLFWLRCIRRKGDYNLYLHAFTKES